MAMVAVQLLVGGMRFCIPESYRSSWRLMHSMWGWATVAAGERFSSEKHTQQLQWQHM
jgi:hypothetical protein